MALGQILRESRERQGYSVSQVAEATRMMVQIVEDLECEDFHRIAAPIYGRGFIKFYAEFLNIDAEPLVKEFTEIYSGARRPVVATRALKSAVTPAPAAPAPRPTPALAPAPLAPPLAPAPVASAVAPAPLLPPKVLLAPQAPVLPIRPTASIDVPVSALDFSPEPVRAAPPLVDDTAPAPSLVAEAPDEARADVRPTFRLEAEPTVPEMAARPERTAARSDRRGSFGRQREPATTEPVEAVDPFAIFDEEERPSLAATLGERCRTVAASVSRGWNLLKRRLRRRRPSGELPRPMPTRLLLIAAAAVVLIIAAVIIVYHVRQTPVPSQPVPALTAGPLKIVPVLPPPEPYVD